jgi:transketolase
MTNKIQELKEKAVQIRKDMYVTTNKIGYSHLGGGNSMMDVAVALYYDFMNWSPKMINDPDRDRFILSKGHCGHVLYNIMVDKGLHTKEELWNGYNQINGLFGMHPNFHYVKGIEASTGSLGHGLSIAFGMAIAGRVDKKNYRVICMVGDGELDEGSNWEAIMSAAHFSLGNLLLIVDYNKCSGSGSIKDVMNLEPLADKFRAFNWNVQEMDGQDMEDIYNTLHALPSADSQTPVKPTVIISHTTKGYTMLGGVEGTAYSHLGFVPDEETLQMCFDSIDAHAANK